MTWMLRHVSLRTKATVTLLVVVVAALLVSSIANIVYTHQLIRRERTEGMARVAAAVADACQLALAVGDRNELRRLVHLAGGDPETLFVAVYDEQEQLAAVEVRDQEAWTAFENDEGGDERSIIGSAPVRFWGAAVDGAVTDLFSGGDLSLYGAGAGDDSDGHDGAAGHAHGHDQARAKGKVVGRVVVGHSINDMIEAQHRHTWITLGVMAGAGVAGGSAMFFIVGVWTRRLDTLMVASDRISHGDLGHAVTATGNDEIGRLGAAFEHMRRTVAQRDMELREFNDTLQQRVDVRTADLARAKAAAEASATSLAESERRIHAIVHSALDAVVGMDADGLITDWNPQAQNIFGWTADEVLGRPLAQTIVPPQSRRDHEEGLQRYLRTGQSKILNRRIEMQAQHREGRQFSIELAITAIQDGERPRFSAFIRDLTERKRADEEREKLTRELITASRQAGMAEVATGVLHNVGNVLNSVNVSASTTVNMLRKSRVAGVSKAVALLQEHAGMLDAFLSADERGKQVLPYLASLGGLLSQEQEQVLEELASLTKNIDHIKQIVAMQQSFARVAGTTEDVELADVIEDALKINSAGLDRHHVHLERRLAELPTIRTDKHKVLQVLTNLIGNAKYAMSAAGGEDRLLIIETGRCDTDTSSGDAAHGRVFVRVIDNGVGIPAQHLTRIFSHGFTTKKDGHGFGLHSGALASRELGGTLTVHSDGPGKGAAFTLELPLVAPRLEARA